MKVEIISPGSYSAAKVTLEKEEQFKTEPGAMIAMDAVMDIDGQIIGDGIGTMVKKAITGSSARQQTITAARGRGEILLAPERAGDICVKALKFDETLILNHGCYLGSSPDVKFDLKFQSPIKTLFGGSTFTMQKLTGHGFVIFSSFGFILKKTLEKGQTYVVDNENLLGFTGTIDYSVSKSGGIISSFLSEGFVYKLKGPGEVYIQTRGPVSMARSLENFFVTKNTKEAGEM